MTLLKHVTSKIGSGVTPRGGDSVYLAEGTPLIRSQNVYNGMFLFDGLAFISEQQASKMNGASVQEDDVLLNITGDSVARVTMVPDELVPARVNQHVAIIRPRRDKLLPAYLKYYLISPVMQAMMLSLAGSGGTRKALTKAMIEGFDVPTPPIAEQQRISDALSAYDDLIENNRRRIKLLEESARLLYREWFVHLRFPGHEHVKVVDGVPVGWGRKSVPDLIAINPKERIERGKEAWYVPMAALSETGMTVDRGDFERRTVHTTVKFRAHDVLLARITPCLENGKTGFVYFLDEGDIACGSTEFIVLRGTSVSPYFVYCLARTYDFREHAIKSMIGSSGRQRVQVGCFDEYGVALPPSSLLSEFDGSVAPMFKQIAVLDQQIERLGQARDLLLPHLMSGDVVSSTESLEAT